MLLDEDISPSLTSIIVKLKLPTDQFELYALKRDPVSLQACLALEYKSLFYSEFFYKINSLSSTQKDSRYSLEEEIPVMLVRNNASKDETYVHGIDNINKLLDIAYPMNSILHQEGSNINLELSILHGWINQTFRKPYFALLLLNENNFRNFEETEALDAEFMRKNIFGQFFPRKDKKIYKYSLEKLERELIPLVEERLQVSFDRKYNFLIKNQVSVADLALYSFLSLLEDLEENYLVRRKILQEFMKNIRNIPLKSRNGNEKKGFDRSRYCFLERKDRCENYEDIV